MCEKELNIETNCALSSSPPHIALRKTTRFYIHCSRYRMYRRLSYIQKCINRIYFAGIQGKVLVNNLILYSIKTTCWFSEPVTFLLLWLWYWCYITNFWKVGESHNLQLLTVCEMFYMYLCLLLYCYFLAY